MLQPKDFVPREPKYRCDIFGDSKYFIFIDHITRWKKFCMSIFLRSKWEEL